MEDEIICFCRCVTKSEIIEAIINKKAKNIEDIQLITKASTGCGRCKTMVISVLSENLQKDLSNLND